MNQGKQHGLIIILFSVFLYLQLTRVLHQKKIAFLPQDRT